MWLALALQAVGMSACTNSRVVEMDYLGKLTSQQNWLVESTRYLGTAHGYHHFAIHEFGKVVKPCRVSIAALNMPSSIAQEQEPKGEGVDVFFVKNQNTGEWKVHSMSELYRETITDRKSGSRLDNWGRLSSHDKKPAEQPHAKP